MNDIFLSHASADRSHAKQVADALAAQGWSVWWDRSIPPGKSFDDVISAAPVGKRRTSEKKIYLALKLFDASRRATRTRVTPSN
ncbi:MAG: toll/interleukin-1 receptor domain-containing protein [Burkholderiales bacterium]